MCCRYVLERQDLGALLGELGLPGGNAFRSRYNIAPGSVVPLIRRRCDGQAHLAEVRWGLVAAWARPNAAPGPLPNVRAETLAGRFRGAAQLRRCVLPASGFFEWQPVGRRKQPWLFTTRDGRPFGLAGIWDTWRADGVVLETCAVITTTPNAVVAPVHDRMPVLLTAGQCAAWLSDDDSDPAAMLALLRPARAEEMTAARVGPAVNHPRNDGPECIAPAGAETDDGSQLSLGL